MLNLYVDTGITVKEGSSEKILSQYLSATDDKSEHLTFTIIDPPKLGRLEYTRRPGRSLKSFTQNDVTSGLVQYVHTSEGEQTRDGFKFSLSDGTNAVSLLYN